jgi:hypothetical protein
MAVLKPCRTPTCTTLVPLGAARCARHTALHASSRPGRHPSTRHGYGRAHWHRVRRARLALANGQCELRLDGCTHRATTVHLDPRRNADHDHAHLSDCQAACAHCHGVVDGGRSSTTFTTR